MPSSGKMSGFFLLEPRPDARDRAGLDLLPLAELRLARGGVAWSACADDATRRPGGRASRARAGTCAAAPRAEAAARPRASGPWLARDREALDAVLEEEAVERRLVLQVDVLLAAPRAVERRLRDVEVAPLEQLRHLPVEEREQQRPDVAAVDVGVGHQDDLVVAELLDVEAPLADAAAERGDERADLGAREHLVEPRALDVQDLPLERQDRLKLPVAPLLRGAAGAVALDDVDLAPRSGRASGSRRACRTSVE